MCLMLHYEIESKVSIKNKKRKIAIEGTTEAVHLKLKSESTVQAGICVCKFARAVLFQYKQ